MTKREHYEKLVNGMFSKFLISHLLLFYEYIIIYHINVIPVCIVDGALMFQQVPLVEIDGMQLVQSRAILNYIAGKYNLYGKDLKERAL